MAAGDPVPWSYIATRVATGSLVADSATWNATESASLLTVSPTLVSGRVYGIWLSTAVSTDVAADQAILRVREDTSAGTQIAGPQVHLPTTSTVGFFLTYYTEYTAVSTGAKSFCLTGQRNGGTGTAHRIRAGTARPTYLTVTLIPV